MERETRAGFCTLRSADRCRNNWVHLSACEQGNADSLLLLATRTYSSSSKKLSHVMQCQILGAPLINSCARCCWCHASGVVSRIAPPTCSRREIVKQRTGERVENAFFGFAHCHADGHASLTVTVPVRACVAVDGSCFHYRSGRGRCQGREINRARAGSAFVNARWASLAGGQSRARTC